MLVLFLAVGMILGGCQNTQEKPQTGKGEETSRDETEDTPEEEKNYDVKLSKNLYDFEFAINEDELFHKIAEFKYEQYIENVNAFYAKIGSFENGKASEKVAEIIENVCKMQ